MKVFTSIVLASVLLFGLTASSSFAQQVVPSGPSPLRGYLIGGGGASIGIPDPGYMLSAEIAENVSSDIQVYMSAAYYDNLISQQAQNDLATVSAVLTASTGFPWKFEGRDRGRSFTVGGKYLIPVSFSVRPYVGGGFGVLNLRRYINERSRGNLTEAFAIQFPSGDGVVDITQTNVNKPMTEVAAGIGVVIRGAYLDFGYRYRKAFHMIDQPLDMSQVGFSAGLKF